MKRCDTLLATFALLCAIAVPAWSAPVNGTYTSTDLGGQMLTGRASVNRTGVNSGLPHVLHAESWDAAAASLGTQWSIDCAIENAPFAVQDNRNASGTGAVIYTSQFTGGTFTFLPGGWPWGDGTGTLGTTTMVSTVQFVNNVPVASVVNGNTSGVFDGGCALTFAIGNGNGVGETPYAVKPADYPAFLDASCGPAPPSQQYGTWGTVITITMNIDCATSARTSTWGAIKTLYR